ncbi:MAG TPA: DUF1343 domain-containing protein [Methylomirabilota bacterium]|nr:DUF1343 domain-containing protein [Methylomirabilota bacterium]
MATVGTGLEQLMNHRASLLEGHRVGVIAHQASVDASLHHVARLLSARKSVKLVALFAPEHGLWGAAQDQVAIRSARDPVTGLPVYSLYGARRTPTRSMLRGLDLLICDLQDIGVRYYTFVWTMALAMEACAAAGIRFVVLDRPNPLGGTLVEGNSLDPRFASFVGLAPIPVRHGLTIGELANYLNERIRCDLTVVRMKAWRRHQLWEETGLPWVAPSPNMPTPDTARVYAGACLIEGTNLSEGRGTTRPFELTGAPFIDPERFAAALNALGLPGVVWRPCVFLPTFHKYKGRLCGGVQWHVTDPKRFKPYLSGLGLIATARRLCPKEFAWRQPPYEFERTKLPIDLLCGTDTIRRQIEARYSLERIEAGWRSELRRFKKIRARYLLYS